MGHLIRVKMYSCCTSSASPISPFKHTSTHEATNSKSLTSFAQSQTRSTFFVERVTSNGNNLHEEVTAASSLSCCKLRLDSHWKNLSRTNNSSDTNTEDVLSFVQ